MAFDVNATLVIRFEDYVFTGPGSATGTQIVPYTLFNGWPTYNMYPTHFFGVREQHDFSGNNYYEWQWYVPGPYFFISYKVWPDPVIGGPEGNAGKTILTVVNSSGGGWITLFYHNEYNPWVDSLAVEAPVGAVGTAVITEGTGPGSVWISNPPQTKDRPIDYNPDYGWDEEGRAWTPTARGGGRYRQQLIAVGKDGEIYYGDV